MQQHIFILIYIQLHFICLGNVDVAYDNTVPQMTVHFSCQELQLKQWWHMSRRLAFWFQSKHRYLKGMISDKEVRSCPFYQRIVKHYIICFLPPLVYTDYGVFWYDLWREYIRWLNEHATYSHNTNMWVHQDSQINKMECSFASKNDVIAPVFTKIGAQKDLPSYQLHTYIAYLKNCIFKHTTLWVVTCSNRQPSCCLGVWLPFVVL